MERITQLQALLEKMPDDAECHYGLAFEYAKAGDTTQAVVHFDKAIALNPEFCYAYYHKGRVLDEAGDPGAAADVLEAGLKVAVALGDDKAQAELEAYLADLM
jgi:tetratricopeptide (TPR) repeat protein